MGVFKSWISEILVKKTNTLVSEEYEKKWEWVDTGKTIFNSLHMGYWPSVRSRLLDIGQVQEQDEVEVHKHAKKDQGQYPAILTKQGWSIKNLLYGIKNQNMVNFLVGQSLYPEQAR